MKITIISSSMRNDSESKKIGNSIYQLLQHKNSSENKHIDLVDYNLPFFNDTLEENVSLQSIWNPISEQLSTSDAFVFVTPEWNGMASPVLKNFFMYVDTELAHKPALLVSVTATTTNGAYPIAELRSSSYKNNHVVYIPHHMIIRNVKNVFNSEIPDPENKDDVYLHTRMNHALDELITYGNYLSRMRTENPFDLEQFSNGM